MLEVEREDVLEIEKGSGSGAFRAEVPLDSINKPHLGIGRNHPKPSSRDCEPHR